MAQRPGGAQGSTEGRQHLLDPLAPFDRRHARQQAGIAHPPAFQRRGIAAVVGREADGVEQPVTQRSRLRDLERLAEPAAGIDEVGGGADIHLALAVVADERGAPGLQPVLRQRGLAVEAAQARLPEGLVDHEQPDRADRLGLHVEEAVMGADDDLRRLRGGLLALIAAGVEVRAEMQLAAALHLAAALLDRQFDLERVEGRFRVEAHQPVRSLRRRIRRGAALPEHGAQAEGLEGRDLLGAEIVARHGVDDLATAEPARGDQIGDRGTRARGLAEAHIHRQAEKRRESRAGHDVEIQRIAVLVRVLRPPRGRPPRRPSTPVSRP